jgi:hypothetical protein
MHLETIWNVATRQGHSLRVLHRDIPVDGVADARGKEPLVGRMLLHVDGRLLRHAPDGGVHEIDGRDVVIEEFTRPLEMRGEPFIPDMSTREGRARMEAAIADPRYHATDADYAVVEIGLVELAGIPGATGHLGSVSFDIR